MIRILPKMKEKGYSKITRIFNHSGKRKRSQYKTYIMQNKKV